MTVETIESVAASYWRDLSGLTQAQSVEDLQAWAARTLGGRTRGFGFNGDVMRARVVHDLFREARCSTFIETGTYRGATTILAARLLRSPTYSCESDTKSWLISALRCAPYWRVHVRRADSRAFLKKMRESLPKNEVPFFYLDAHWNSDLPLQGELETIAQNWERFVALIDDFVVPGQPGFGFDTYESGPLTLERFRIPACADGRPPAIFFPGYPPEQEVGARRGYVVFVGGMSHGFDRKEFALNLLAEYAPRS